MKKILLGTTASFLTFASANFSTYAIDRTYTVSYVYPGGYSSISVREAVGINDKADVAFNAGLDTGYQFGWPAAFSTQLGELSIIGGAYPDEGGGVYAAAINASGQIAGSSVYQVYEDENGGLVGYGPYHAFLTATNSGVLQDLGTLGGSASSASGVNASGRVVGQSQTTGDQQTHAFMSAANGGGLTDLGTFGGQTSIATGINDKGDVVGYSKIGGNSLNHAFFRSSLGGTLRDLGTLGGNNSYATGVNRSGQVVGKSQIGNGASHVFISDSNGGTLHDIGVVPANDAGRPGINDHGQVVGNRSNGDAFLYTPGAGVRNVNDLFDHSLVSPDFYVESAGAINNLGEIAGVATAIEFESSDGSNNSVYVISPVPRVETEGVPVTELSGARHSIAKDNRASGGYFSSLNATGANQYVTYSIPVATPGTYRVEMGVRTGPARGTFQLSIAGVNQGASQEEYSTVISYQKRDLGRITFQAGGNKAFKFLVTGRNASSSGYGVAFDYVALVPTARFETEELKMYKTSPKPANLSAAQWYGIFNNSGASRGAGTYLNATAPGQYATYTVRVAKTGRYILAVGMQKKPDKGIFQLAINGVNSIQADEYGGPGFDWTPQSTQGRYEVNLTAGSNVFTFTVTGKNAESSGYTLAFDYIDLIPR